MHCVMCTCEPRSEQPFNKMEYSQEKEVGLHRNYNDRAYFNSQDLIRDDSQIGPRGAATSAKASIRLLKVDHMRITLITQTHPAGEVHGQIVKHRALFAETFSAILTSMDPTHLNMGGITMLTLSDTENNVHFVLDPDFAEVLVELGSQEMRWLAQGQLRMIAEVEGGVRRKLAGHITVRRSCDTIQSVLCGANALIPTHTGAIQVAGTGSEVIGITLETKPRRRNKRSILYDMTHSYRDGTVSVGWQKSVASGSWTQASGRDAHMLLQNELFLNVATKDFEDGELQFPIPLAGQFVSPAVHTGSAGHAWVSLDGHCHLHYEIVVAGLGRADDGTVSAHLHGFAELGEIHETSLPEHRRLLRSFYGTQVHIPNQCRAGSLRMVSENLEEEPVGVPRPRDPKEWKKDPNTCFFEGQHRPHGSRWAPDYDKKCSICICQKQTVICDPVLCQPLNCSQPVQQRCYFDGDKTWRRAGTHWHPVVPPFGLIKCAICTCKGTTGEVHCEKVQCPQLVCNNPIRVNPSDCCKQCPALEKSSSLLSDMMQADGPRACKFGRQWYMHNERWHPTVPPFGEMKCITCWCLAGETHSSEILQEEAQGTFEGVTKHSWRH
ncbi:hypothetical protein E2320_009199 [Naja naja]|nr:hypothetical protein E2320_009199 [Naja naja]